MGKSYPSGRLHESPAVSDSSESAVLRLLSIGYSLLGVLRRDAGDFDEALRHLTRALRLDPENATAFYHRSIVHAHLGNPLQYMEDLDRAKLHRPHGVADNFSPISLRHEYVLAVDADDEEFLEERATFPTTDAGLVAAIEHANGIAAEQLIGGVGLGPQLPRGRGGIAAVTERFYLELHLHTVGMDQPVDDAGDPAAL